MLDRDALFEAYAIDDRREPRLRVNFVSSLDGAATVDGRSGGLGNADDQQIMGVLRAMCDVILIGAGTVRAEGYGGVRLSEANSAWRVEQGLTPHPPLAVVSSALRLDPEHPFFSEAVARPYVITHAAAPPDRLWALSEVADVLVCGESSVDLRVATATLAERGMPQVLCEGGPHLFGDLAVADLVDEFCLSLSALIVAGEAGRITSGAPALRRELRLLSTLPTDEMLFLRYARRS